MHTVDSAPAWSKEAAPYESTAAKPYTLFVIATMLLLAGLAGVLVGTLLVDQPSGGSPARSGENHSYPARGGAGMSQAPVQARNKAVSICAIVSVE